MANMKALTTEMAKLKGQIETLMNISGYRAYDDLSALDDYKQIRTADGLQMLEEYRNILYKLDEVRGALSYYDKPVKEVGRLHMNKNGRYETDGGYCYTSGSSIEFTRLETVYNGDTDEWEEVNIWTTSRVEHNGQDYYIVGFSNIEMSGLKVRRRG